VSDPLPTINDVALRRPEYAEGLFEVGAEVPQHVRDTLATAHPVQEHPTCGPREIRGLGRAADIVESFIAFRGTWADAAAKHLRDAMRMHGD
jgi:hypothetical protein